MRHAILILAICLGSFTGPLVTHSAGTTSVNRVFVYKPDGTKHCETHAGVSVKSMASELADAGVEVYSSRKGHDGREGVAICGDPTGQINIYEILSSDLTLARRMGFKRLPENWIKKH